MEAPQKIQIFGERCSGTTYLEHILKNNLKSVQICNDFGWKHFFPKTDPLREDEYIFFFLFRNPFDWLRSLHRQPFHAAPSLKNLSFSEFIRQEWYCVWNEDGGKEPDDPLYEKEMMFERDPETGERFGNVIRMRSGKIKNWTRLHAKVKQSKLIQYQLIKSDPGGFIDLIADTFHFQKNDKFQNVIQYRGTGSTYKPKDYQAIEKDDMEYILSELDHKLERQIGFNLDKMVSLNL